MEPKPVLPFRFLREFMGSLHDPEIARCDHEPIRVRNAGFIRQCSAGLSLRPDESGVPMRRFMGRFVRGFQSQIARSPALTGLSKGAPEPSFRLVL